MYLHDVESVRVEWTQNGWQDGWKFKGIKILYALSGHEGLFQTPLYEQDATGAIKHFTGNGTKNWTSNPFTPQLPEASEQPVSPASTAPASGRDLNAIRHFLNELEPGLSDIFNKSFQSITRGHPGPNDRMYFDDLRKEKLLLSHLNANRVYYSRCIWLSQDPDERIQLMWSNAWLRNSGVLNLIDYTPVGVSGTHVAYPFHGTPPFNGQLVDINAKEARAVRTVTLLSRGVFAELHLSHCSAREERDPSRMYDPSEMIMPKAPEITGIQPGSRHDAPDLQPSDLTNPIINIQNVPNAPDPSGLAAALGVIGRGDIFRDMSTAAEVSSLLNGIISGAISGNEAKAAAQKVQQSLGKSTISGATHPARSGNAIDTHDRLKLLEQSDLPNSEKEKIKRNILDPGSASNGQPPTLLVSTDVPQTSGTIFDTIQDHHAGFMMQLAGMDDAFFETIRLTRQEALSYTQDQWHQIQDSYWMEREQLNAISDWSSLNALHKKIDRMYVSYTAGYYLDAQEYEDMGGLATNRIPTSTTDSATFEKTAWLRIAGLFAYGKILGADPSSATTWDVPAGLPTLDKYLNTRAKPRLEQILKFIDTQPGFASDLWQNLQQYLEKCRADYSRVANLLSPASSKRAEFLQALNNEANVDVDILNIKLRYYMDRQEPVQTYIVLDEYLEMRVKRYPSPQSLHNSLPDALKLLWSYNQLFDLVVQS